MRKEKDGRSYKALVRLLKAAGVLSRPSSCCRHFVMGMNELSITNIPVKLVCFYSIMAFTMYKWLWQDSEDLM